MGDRFFELSKSGPCAIDAFFQRLHTLDGATIDDEHTYLIQGIRAAAAELGAHQDYAEEVIAHIECERQRWHDEQPCIDTNGRPLGPVYLRPKTQAAE